MAHPNIRAVFLDAGNTLFTERRPRPAIYLTVARAHGGRGDEEQVREAMVAAIADLPSSIEGAYRYSVDWFRSFNGRVLGALKVSEKRQPDAHEDLVQRFESARSYRLYKEAPAVLEELANLGLVVGVVSNWSERLPLLLEALGIASSLQFVVTSAEIKSEKPDRAIFDRALFRAGVPAEEALHVGDHMERDVRGALNAGLRAAWVDRTRTSNGRLDGVPVIHDLRGVLGLVGQPTHAARD